MLKRVLSSGDDKIGLIQRTDGKKTLYFCMDDAEVSVSLSSSGMQNLFDLISLFYQHEEELSAEVDEDEIPF